MECSGNQYQWSRAAEAWLMQHKNIILYPVEAAACHSHNELFPVRCPAIKIIFLIPAKIYVWPARGPVTSQSLQQLKQDDPSFEFC